MNYNPKYNPNIHHRRSIRLKGYDYSKGGMYFITICCEDRKYRFGKIDVGAGFDPAQRVLNELGNIAYHEWIKLPDRFTNFELDVFQIMPNHMHGIILMNNVEISLSDIQINIPNVNVEAGLISTQIDDNKDAGFVPVQINETENTIDDNGQQSNVQSQDNRARVNRAPTVGDIVGAYKSLVFNACLESYKSKNEIMGKLWQRNYHEHIIRK